MATGLNLDGGFAELANPYSLSRPTDSGISQMAQETISRIPQEPIQQAPAAQDASKFWTNQQTGEFYVNGVTFSQDDDTQILRAEELLDKPSVGRPQGEGWMPVTRGTYGQIADRIRNPTLGRLFAKNFGIGVDQLQQLAGSALQLAGAEELGGRIVEQQEEDLAKTSVYQRDFTDIESGGDVVDWFVANLGQQGPMLLESLAAAGIGAAAGTAVGGPGLGTAGGLVAGVFKKQAFKKAVDKAAKRYTADKAKGVAPKPGDVKILRNAAGYAGAAGGAFLSNYALGTGDIYGEMREQGVDPDDTAARMQALMGAFPYAAADTLGEYVLASRLFGGIRPRAMPEGATRLQRGTEYGRRGVAGGAVGAGIEGTTETAQEAIVMGLSGQDLTSDEAINRFINSFAAGAAVGGAVGSVANLRRGKSKSDITPQGEPTNDGEVNLLDSSGSATQTQGVQPRTQPGQPMAERGFVGDVEPGQFGPQGVIDLGGMTVGEARLRSRTPAGGSIPLQLEAPPTPRTGRIEYPSGLVYQGQLVDGVPNGEGTMFDGQGGGETQTGRFVGDELVSGTITYSDGSTSNVGGYVPPPPTGQGVLQFAPPAPEGIGFTDQQPVPNTLMAQQMQEAQRRREAEIAAQQRQQQLAAEREQQMNLMEAQQQQQIAEQARIEEQRDALPQPPAELPTRPVPIRQPQQLPLFTPDEAPRPSRAEGLRRGVGTQVTPAAAVQQPTGVVTTELDAQGAPQIVRTDTTPMTPQQARRAGQIPLITQAGQPMPATPAAAEAIAAAQRRIALKRAVGRVEYDNGDVYEGQLKKGEPNGEGIYYVANGDVYIGRMKDGLYEGKGRYLYSDGSTYVGDFKNDEFDGQGVFTDADGTIMDGQFEEGSFVEPTEPTEPPPAPRARTLKRGRQDAAQGPSTAPVPTRRGAQATDRDQQINDLINEFDSQTEKEANFDELFDLPNGIYTGQVVGGKRSGKGRMSYDNGVTYLGNFVDGEIKDPNGTLILRDGTIFTGDMDGINGVGEAALPDGTRAPARLEGGEVIFTDAEQSAPRTRAPRKEKKPAPEKKTKGDTLKKGKSETKAAPVATPTEEPFTPASMAELEARAAAQRPVRTQPDRMPTVSEIVDEEISTAETAVDSVTFAEAIRTLAFHAYVDTDSNNRAANTKAREYIESRDFTATERQSLNDALVDEINNKGQIELYRGDNFKPVYAYLVNNSLLPRLTATTSGLKVDDATRLVEEKVLALTNLTDKTARDVIAANPDLLPTQDDNLARGRDDKVSANDGTRLADSLRELNTTTTRFNESTRAQKIADIEAQWDALADEYRDFVDAAGVPLSAYFDGDKLRTAVINGRLRAVVETLSTEQIAEIEADITQAAVNEREAELQRREESMRLSRDPSDTLDFYDDDVASGSYSRDDGSTITTPLSVGRIRMAVTKFVNKLVNKPKVTIYKNQADLKAKNPRLHQRAADSRPQGDFDSVSAAGFSFGDGNVIIFSDRIATEQQLDFILAHETLGHFGLRGIIPANKFDAVMNEIYNLSPAIQADVDAAMMANDGMGRAEAVEEYLSDFAGQVDTSIIARVWNAIKGALNKLGIQFGDEAARYFVSQARRYVRNGGAGVPFEVSSVIRRLHEIEYGMTPAGTGRFATVAGNVSEDTTAAALMIDKVGGLPMNVQEGWNWLKGEGVNSVATYDKFKAKFLSLANFRARENPGSYAMEQLLEEMRNRSMSIKVEMNEKLREVLNKAVFGRFWGITDAQLANLNDVLYEAQRLSVNNFDRAKEMSRAPLYTLKDGVLVPNQAEIDRLAEMGRITFEQMRDGFEYEVQAIEDGQQTTRTERFAGIPDLTEDSIEWRGYNQLRDVMNDVELQLLRARYASAIAEQNVAFSELGEFTEAGELSAADESFIRRAVNKYKDLYTQGLTLDERGYVTLDQAAMERGNKFLESFNAALIGRGTDRTAAVTEFFEGKAADDFGTYLNEFKTRLRLPDDNKFIIQNRVKQLVLSEMTNTDADLFTRRSIATGYTPILREGAYQVRVEATDPNTGKRVQLKESSRDQLVYSQFNSPKESLQYSDLINEVFDGKSYKLEVYDQNSGTYVIRDVKLQAVSEAALDSVAAPPELNLNEFVRGLRQFDIALTPQKMERVVTALTRQNNAARNRLERAFVKGAKRDGVAAISRHVESRASTIAKTQLRPHMSELMNLGLSKTQKLWNGDKDVLDALKENADRVEADPTATDEAKSLARKEYQRYNFMYQTTNPKGAPRKGMEYYNEASRTASFLEGNRNVDESDFGSGKLVSGIRASTSMMQLGGSIATGVLNVISAYTNGIPYLASYNDKNGFGGGFGMGPVVAQFHTALGQVGGIGMNPFSETSRAANRAEFYDRMVDRANMTADQRAEAQRLREEYKLESHEAQFIAREIREGAMIPAQSNALVGTSRGRITTGFGQKLIDNWMLTFNLTEQASRRALGLTAYRLEYQQQIKAGKTEAQAQSTARTFAVNALQLTLGEYSVLNRPPAWRSGIQSFIYMYKVFPTTSIQLMANLSRNGRLGMLTGLFLLSGLSGLPFAEDLEDIIDTLGQKLGFKSGSIRFEAAKFIDGIFPGMSPMVLTGFMNAVSPLPGNIGSRTSLGNVLPGTGMFLAGANTSREMMDIAGPAASAITGSVKTLSDTLRLPFSDQVTTLGVLRDSPITMLRASADAYAYNQTGAIVDRRGYMVSDDMTAGTIAARLLGFYPTAASDQYSMIRVAKRMTDYQRDVTTGFRSAWINAMQSKDTARARNIEDAVREWNNGAKGTALEIKNFRSASMRALREARRPAGERALRSAPRAAREDIERLSTLLAY